MIDNRNTLETGLEGLGLESKETRTDKGYAFETSITYKKTPYPVRIFWSEHSTKLRIEMLSANEVAPEMADDVDEILSTINIRSPRFKWRLHDTGHYALEVKMHHMTVQESVSTLPKVLREMARKRALFSPSIEAAATGTQPFLDVLINLVNIH